MENYAIVHTSKLKIEKFLYYYFDVPPFFFTRNDV